MLTAEQHEEVFGWLCELGESVSFDVKATAAPQFRRIVRQRSSRLAGAGFRFADGLDRPGPAKGVNDARGFMFVSHLADDDRKIDRSESRCGVGSASACAVRAKGSASRNPLLLASGTPGGSRQERLQKPRARL
jgi:hypothetical protein